MHREPFLADGKSSPWDQPAQLKANHEKNARITEQSVAALISELHQRGLLDETKDRPGLVAAAAKHHPPGCTSPFPRQEKPPATGPPAFSMTSARHTGTTSPSASASFF